MNIDETFQDKRLFLVFSLAVLTLSKSARLLLERGADPLAISHLNRGIELISIQLGEAARRMENEIEAGRELNLLLDTLGIPKPPDQPGVLPPAV